MDTKNQTQCVDKADALDILDRTIDFVRNCDNKASIFLGTFGVILTIVLTTEGLNNLMSIVRTAIAQKTFCNALYLLLLAGSIIVMVFGLSQIIKEVLLNDVISQIYINSCICHDKYKNYQCGLKWTLIGFCGFSVLWIIGAVIF